jgi:hypothetical protein
VRRHDAAFYLLKIASQHDVILNRLQAVKDLSKVLTLKYPSPPEGGSG